MVTRTVDVGHPTSSNTLAIDKVTQPSSEKYLNQIKSNEEFVVRSIQRNRGLLRITTIKYKKIKPRAI